ncbi:hypothetical protein ES706_01873 [subsurface metagenome]
MNFSYESSSKKDEKEQKGQQVLEENLYDILQIGKDIKCIEGDEKKRLLAILKEEFLKEL